MLTLILMPGASRLEYALYRGNADAPICSGNMRPYRGEEDGAIQLVIKKAQNALRLAKGFVPDAIALRSPFGGALFRKPVRAEAKVIHQLQSLVRSAPLHIPPLMAMTENCLRRWPSVPCRIFFESSFFVNLPVRERTYALGGDAGWADKFRRFGYHGIYHAAAISASARSLFPRERRSGLRALSFCLEPRSEMTAVLGARPLMTTSGVTPLEGLPGDGLCGEIDPGIIIMLNEKKKWGPERINHMLTEESGIRGLTSRAINLEQLFNDNKSNAAREIIQYRFLLSAGAGLAALNGVDMIVYSGRYAILGEMLGAALATKLARCGTRGQQSLPVYVFKKNLSRVIADAMMTESRI